MELKKCIQSHGSNYAEVAKECGVSKSAVSQWVMLGVVPAEHCPKIERLFVGGITCEEMNPNVDWGYLRKTKKRSNKGESNG